MSLRKIDLFLQKRQPRFFYPAMVLAGAAMALAMPPVGLIPAVFLAVPFFIRATVFAPRKRDAFFTGWAFGAGYFIAGLYWISAALFVDIAAWFWVLPLSLVVGPALLGLYWGIAAWAVHPLRAAPLYPLAMVAAWSVAEFLRGILLTGFPWNLAGYGWEHINIILQTASVTGIHGLSFLTLFWAAAVLCPKNSTARGVAIFSFAAAAGFGFVQLHLSPTVYTADGIRIVQPHIKQDMKWDQAQEWQNFNTLLNLTRRDSDIENFTPVYVVWPETAATADMVMYPDMAHKISDSFPRDAIGLIGNLRITENDGGDRRFFNSVTVLDNNGQVYDAYDKHHLVPFGEYIPFRDTLNLTPLGLAVSGIGDFTRGTGPRTMTPPPASPATRRRFSPLVCYEVIFPNAVIDKNNRPDFMVNVTNDAWYGHSAGPYQHMAIARLRAIEEGIPLIRAANTGISAIVDARGRVVASLPLGAFGVVDGHLPVAAAPTLYAQYRHGFFFAFVLFSIGASCLSWRKAIKKHMNTVVC